MTGVGTVSSISRELAVDHASVQIMIQDHDRRISKLEHDIVPRSEHDEKDKALSENLQNMQDQLKQANSNIDEIRKFMIDQYSTRKR